MTQAQNGWQRGGWTLGLALLMVLGVCLSAEGQRWKEKTPAQWSDILQKSLEKENRPAIREQWYAVYALGEYAAQKDAEQTDAIVEILLKRLAVDQGQDDYVRAAIATTLGKIGDAQAIPALTEALTSDYTAIRRCAADALNHFGQKASVPATRDALKKVLKEDSDATTRSNAAVTLWNTTSDAAALEYLEKLLDSKKSLEKYQAATAIGRLEGLSDKVSAKLGKGLIPLLALTGIQDQDTARAGVAALVQLGKPTLAEVRKAFRTAKNDLAKSRYLTVLANIDISATTSDELLQLAKAKETPMVVRIAAIRGLRNVVPEKRDAAKALVLVWTKDTDAPRNIVFEATQILKTLEAE